MANAWFGVLKAYYRLRGRSEADAIYGDPYFDVEEEMTLDSADAVAECLLLEFQPASVADVGCGTAVYLAALERRGLEVRGFEWSSAAIDRAHIDRAKICQRDLREPLPKSRAFDLVLCFEVAEHLAEEHSEKIVENICGLGSTIAFSAAQPGQGGTDHVNEQVPAFWVRQFAKQGYSLEGERTERLRGTLAARSCVWWLEKNLMIFQAASPPTSQEP